MTPPFQKPEIVPPRPCWLVRRPTNEAAIEIVHVGNLESEKLESAVERLARWAWPFDEKDARSGVVVLGDARAMPIGIRLESTTLTLLYVVSVAGELLRPSDVCQVMSPHPSKD